MNRDRGTLKRTQPLARKDAHHLLTAAGAAGKKAQRAAASRCTDVPGGPPQARVSLLCPWPWLPHCERQAPPQAVDLGSFHP